VLFRSIPSVAGSSWQRISLAHWSLFGSRGWRAFTGGGVITAASTTVSPCFGRGRETVACPPARLPSQQTSRASLTTLPRERTHVYPCLGRLWPVFVDGACSGAVLLDSLLVLHGCANEPVWVWGNERGKKKRIYGKGPLVPPLPLCGKRQAR
jgi:hypothetical protein